MSEQYYIRLRGRVQGPFDAEKLRNLARRGQFSRMHEVSTDGQAWMQARERPELFAAPQPPVELVATSNTKEATAQREATTATAQPVAVVAAAASTVAKLPAVQWYFVYNGQQQGPVDQPTLVEMLQSGRIPTDTDVWEASMTEWVPASSLPVLMAKVQKSAGSNASTISTASITGTGDLQEREPSLAIVAPALVGSQGWIIFIAIMVSLYTALLLFGGLILVILGSRSGASQLVFSGLIQMLVSGVTGLGAMLLFQYSGGISKFDRSMRIEHLRRALEKLKAFWMLVGIVLIVFLTFVLITVALIFASVVSLPNFS